MHGVKRNKKNGTPKVSFFRPFIREHFAFSANNLILSITWSECIKLINFQLQVATFLTLIDQIPNFANLKAILLLAIILLAIIFWLFWSFKSEHYGQGRYLLDEC